MLPTTVNTASATSCSASTGVASAMIVAALTTTARFLAFTVARANASPNALRLDSRFRPARKSSRSPSTIFATSNHLPLPVGSATEPVARRVHHHVRRRRDRGEQDRGTGDRDGHEDRAHRRAGGDGPGGAGAGGGEGAGARGGGGGGGPPPRRGASPRAGGGCCGRPAGPGPQEGTDRPFPRPPPPPRAPWRNPPAVIEPAPGPPGE